MMKPMALKMLSVEPAISSPRNTPISDIGSDIMMAIGCRKLPNCDARIR